jgi:hypothetical protein
VEEADGPAAPDLPAHRPAPRPAPPSRARALTQLAFELGRNLLSPTNLVERSTVGQYLLIGARAANRADVTVNVEMRLVDPISIMTPPIRLALLRLEVQFRDGLRALEIDRNEVFTAEISVRFDFATARPSHLKGQMFSVHMIEPETVNYDCTVRIRNAEGEHRVRVPEWWR